MSVVFTNGCFDLLHVGHIANLNEAAGLGHRLFVAINSDSSVRKLKGPGRPLIHDRDRAVMVAALAVVSHVLVFDDATPQALIEAIRPSVLVKGGSYHDDEIVGADFVRSYGGEVHRATMVQGISTTQILDAMRHPHEPIQAPIIHSLPSGDPAGTAPRSAQTGGLTPDTADPLFPASTTRLEMNLKKIRRMALVRNSHMGDLVCSLPAFEALRQGLPQAHITAIANDVSAPLLDHHPDVDEVLLDDENDPPGAFDRPVAGRKVRCRAGRLLQPPQLLGGAASRVPIRVTHGRRWFQALCGTHRTYRWQKKPPYHEAAFILSFVQRLGIPFTLADARPRLHVDPASRRESKSRIVTELGFEGPIFAVHPGSRGSDFNWPIGNYFQLIERLSTVGRVLVTGNHFDRQRLDWIESRLTPALRERVLPITDLAHARDDRLPVAGRLLRLVVDRHAAPRRDRVAGCPGPVQRSPDDAPPPLGTDRAGGHRADHPLDVCRASLSPLAAGRVTHGPDHGRHGGRADDANGFVPLCGVNRTMR